MVLNTKQSTIIASVIILNYQGEKVIEKVIASVLASSFPQNHFEIIIPDNNSQDKSKPILTRLAKKYPALIKPLFLDKNYGFAAGNNKAIAQARGKYIVLLNNDCIVEKSWLSNLIKAAESNKNIFSVNSKILLYPHYFTYHFEIIDNFPLIKIDLTKSHLLDYQSTKKPLILPFTPTPRGYYLDIPTDQHDKTIELNFTFLNPTKTSILPDIFLNSEPKPQSIKYSKKGGKVLATASFLLSNIKNNYFKKVQNAGNFVFQDGYGRDIGAKVKYMTQDYEKDMGQFDNPREVYSTCGAACLYRKEILDKVGPLDENFFMYYEDVEICERARLAGYINVYCPSAVAHHLHALSSREWSSFFIFNVEKGRLLHTYYHFPFPVFLKEFLKYSLAGTYSLFRSLKRLKIHQSNFVFLKVIFMFILLFPKYLVKKLSFARIYNPMQILKNYQQIISGYWYFN